MSQKGWWGVVALGLLLGLVVGGVAGYVIGARSSDQSTVQAIDSERSNEPNETALADDSPSDDPAQEVSDADICNASDVYNALDIFGRNAQTQVSASALTQIRKAGKLFDQASGLAQDPDLVSALNKLAEVSLGLEQGDVYSFAAYNRFSTACSGIGL